MRVWIKRGVVRGSCWSLFSHTEKVDAARFVDKVSKEISGRNLRERPMKGRIDGMKCRPKIVAISAEDDSENRRRRE